jgi:DnaJ-class molecular chaperone
MQVTCYRCGGVGLIQTRFTAPSRIYGEPRQVSATRTCDACQGKGKKEIKPDAQTAGD